MLKLDSMRKSRKCDKCIPVSGMKTSWFERNTASTNSSIWLRLKNVNASERNRYRMSLLAVYASSEIARTRMEKATSKMWTSPSLELNISFRESRLFSRVYVDLAVEHENVNRAYDETVDSKRAKLTRDKSDICALSRT